MMDLDKLRNILNFAFIMLAVVSIIVYFTCNNLSLFIYLCGIAIVIKMIESVIRFTDKYRKQ
jgi:capsular polysaccharide biosynthesis protein